MRKTGIFAFVLLICLLFFQPVFSDTATIRDLSFDTEARELDLDGLSLSFSELRSLIEACPELQTVTAWNTVLETGEFEKIREDRPNLELRCTLHLVARHFIRTDAAVFSTLHGSCGEHSSKALRGLQYCTDLVALDIGHNALTDISFLAKLPKLRVLILAVNQIRDISVLSQLKDLEYIELFSNNIRDLTPLAELPHLIDLNLSYNPGVKSLEPLKKIRTLRRLWLPQTRGCLDKEMIASLHEAIPEAVIMTTGHPTANGWREDHPHYQIIYKMFRGDTYIPFEDSFPMN